MIIVAIKIPLSEIKKITEERSSDYVKAVVDIERKIMALDAELHSDLEAKLLEEGSDQENLWGINIYPDSEESERIEFDSMINIRPRQNNRSRYVEDENTRKMIIDCVNKLIE